MCGVLSKAVRSSQSAAPVASGERVVSFNSSDTAKAHYWQELAALPISASTLKLAVLKVDLLGHVNRRSETFNKICMDPQQIQSIAQL